MCVCLYACLFAYNSGTGGAIIFKFSALAPWCFSDDSGAKMGVLGRGHKIGVFSLSRDRLTMRHCSQIGHLALDTQAQADNVKTQYTQALVLTGRHVYYARVRKAGEKRHGAAYVMPDWACRMASVIIDL